MTYKVTFLGSLAMGNAFWYDCNYNGDGGGNDKMELKLQKRVNKNSDIDLLILDSSVTDIEIDEYIDNFLINWRGCKIEKHYIEPLVKYLEQHKLLRGDGRYDKDFKNVLFTLKASHVSWDDKHQKKTFYDLYLMSYFGAKIIPELYFDLVKFWENKFGYKPWRADFTMESKDFFNDAVSREELHDNVHWKVKKFDKPAYMYLQEEGQTTVYVDEKKFWEVDEEVRRAVIIEEAQALAIERIIEPGKRIPARAAYRLFIEGLVERLSPQWMVPYIVNNFHYFIDYEEDYVKKFKV